MSVNGKDRLFVFFMLLIAVAGISVMATMVLTGYMPETGYGRASHSLLFGLFSGVTATSVASVAIWGLAR